MKLHAPGFERALRRRVRRTVQGSRELKKEFRQANRFRRQIVSIRRTTSPQDPEFERYYHRTTTEVQSETNSLF